MVGWMDGMKMALGSRGMTVDQLHTTEIINADATHKHQINYMYYFLHTQIMEKLRLAIKPVKFAAIKVTKSTLEFLRFEAEINNRAMLETVIKKIDLKASSELKVKKTSVFLLQILVSLSYLFFLFPSTTV